MRVTVIITPPPQLAKVFDIGARGDEPVHKVAELPDYLQEVTRLSGARQQVFGAGDDKRSTAIKYLAVVREYQPTNTRLAGWGRWLVCIRGLRYNHSCTLPRLRALILLAKHTLLDA